MTDLRDAIANAIKSHSSPTIGRGDIHGGQAGYIIYERDGLPGVIAAIERAIGERILKTAEPSDAGLNAAAKAGTNNIRRLRAAYAIDVAPLIAERDRLSRQNAALVDALARLVNNESADWFSTPDVSGNLGLRIVYCREERGPSFRAKDIAHARAALAQLDALPAVGADPLMREAHGKAIEP